MLVKTAGSNPSENGGQPAGNIPCENMKPADNIPWKKVKPASGIPRENVGQKNG